MDYRIYLAGPSAELWDSEPGETEIEKLFVEFEENGLKPVFDWPEGIRKFRTAADGEDDWVKVKYLRKRSMRKDYARIVEADVLVFAMIKGAPSTGMMFEAGVATFLGKPIIYYTPSHEMVKPAVDLSSHEFFTLARSHRFAHCIEDVKVALQEFYHLGKL